MSIPHSIRDAIPTVHREGYPFIGGTLAAAVLLGLFWQPGFWLLAALAGWMVIFFRDPDRVVPVGPGLVVSPADGRIEPVVEAVPPPELELGPEPRTRISVFMNVFDCHINRAPVAGIVKRVAYKPGKFFNADLDKASEHNERNSVLFQLADGTVVPTVQIAGLVARRILCWTGEGARLGRGERFGMIRFGSRLDVYLPAGAEVTVLAGQRAVGGETVIARLATAEGEAGT
ncbi:MAG TPA: phosphatidylserine decarboxylase [Afifellaceae bacterium]|nr:phosphatidylserine decarboxylase [Afifellaceae bacterium]